jgi:hypothetical protein
VGSPHPQPRDRPRHCLHGWAAPFARARFANIGNEDATLAAPSVLVVPPDFDGLLHAEPCRSIAPCSQPWGSPRFRSPDIARQFDFCRPMLQPGSANGTRPTTGPWNEPTFPKTGLSRPNPSRRHRPRRHPREDAALARAVTLSKLREPRVGRPLQVYSIRTSFPGGASTLRSVPLASSSTASPRPLPSRRCSSAAPGARASEAGAACAVLRSESTSGLCSTDESVAFQPRFHDRSARCFLGLSRPRIWASTACLRHHRHCVGTQCHPNPKVPRSAGKPEPRRADDSCNPQKPSPQRTANSNPTRHIPLPEGGVPKTRLRNSHG